MAEPRQVALLALAYGELARHPEPGPLAALEDLETCPGDLSWLGMMAADQATAADWALVRVMAQNPPALPRIASAIASCDALRAEALLHAWPSEAPPPEGEWTLPFGADRWELVEAAMRRLRAEGLTLSHDDQDSLAISAVAAATGASAKEVIAAWF